MVGVPVTVGALITWLVSSREGYGAVEEERETIFASSSPSQFPTTRPSSIPTATAFRHKYPPPGNSTCQALLSGDGPGISIEGDGEVGNNNTETQELDFSFDVALSEMTPQQETEWLKEFRRQIEISLIPILVGCPGLDADDDGAVVRRLDVETGLSSLGPIGSLQDDQLHRSKQVPKTNSRSSTSTSRRARKEVDGSDEIEIEIRYVIFNAEVLEIQTAELLCSTEDLPEISSPSCYQLTATLRLWLKGEERVILLLSMVTAVLSEWTEDDGSDGSDGDENGDDDSDSRSISLVEKLGLPSPPFQEISLVGVQSHEPSNKSHAPSLEPSISRAPSTSEVPSKIPSKLPSKVPSEMPSKVPFKAPV